MWGAWAQDVESTSAVFFFLEPRAFLAALPAAGRADSSGKVSGAGGLSSNGTESPVQIREVLATGIMCFSAENETDLGAYFDFVTLLYLTRDR